jgi:DNA polymerase III gamma/tau subunit
LGLVNQTTIGTLFDHMIAGETGPGLALLNELVAEGVELGQLVDQVVAYLRAVLVGRVAGSTDQLDLPQDIRAQLAKQAPRVEVAALLAAVREWTDARAALRDQIPGVPQLPLELAFLRSAGALTSKAGIGLAPPSAAPQPAPARVSHTPEQSPSGPAAIPAAFEQKPAAAAHKEPGEPQGSRTRQTQPATTASSDTESLPAQAPSQAAEGSVGEGDLQQRVKANWDRFLELARSQYGFRLPAALKNVKEVQVVGRVLVLHFPAAHNFSREMIEAPEHKAQVESAWRQVLGEDVGVRCTTIGAPAKTGPVEAASGGDALLEDAKRRGAVVRQLD